MSESRMNVVFSEGDAGESAVDRTFRATVMVVSNAIQCLIEHGWSRDDIRIVVEDSVGMFATIHLNDKPIFLIGPGRDADDGALSIRGFWISPIPHKEEAAKGEPAVKTIQKKTGLFRRILNWLGIRRA